MKEPNPIPAKANQYAQQLVDFAFKVHSTLGPGLLETVYEACLAHELAKRGIPFEKQVRLSVRYDRIQVDAGLRIDLWIDRCLIVELKALETISNEDISRNDYLSYQTIPENRKLFYDIVIRNAYMKGKNVSIAIQFQEKLVDGKVNFIPKVEKIGKIDRK